MRILSVLLTSAAACALAGSLTGCSGSSSSSHDGPDVPAASASPSATASALDLVGTTWHVVGRSGTTVRFDGLAITVTDGGRSSGYAWSAQGDPVLIGGSSSALNGAVGPAWLTSATRVQRTGAGWRLLAASGAATAQLTPGGTAQAATATTLLTAAVPGPGVVDAPATAVEGRWTVGGNLRSAITFGAGAWRATSSCATGAVGGAGVYRVLPKGRLLVTRTMTPIRGCPVMGGLSPANATAITAIGRAASFRVRGDTLTLFDRSGTELGSLTRG